MEWPVGALLLFGSSGASETEKQKATKDSPVPQMVCYALHPASAAGAHTFLVLMRVMKKAKLIFPCKIDWNSMQDHEKGKFCEACQKAVQDYTKTNLDTVKESMFCGRFNNDQLEYHTSRFETRNYAPLTLSLLNLLGTGTDAQTTPAINPDSTSVSTPFKFGLLRFPLRLEGKLTNKETGLALADAGLTIIQRDSSIYSSKTDSGGRFSFILLEKDIREAEFDLKVSYGDSLTPEVNDTIFKLPLRADTVKASAVFALEFMVKPQTPAITIVGAPLVFTVNPDFGQPHPIGGTVMITDWWKLVPPDVYTVQVTSGYSVMLPQEEPVKQVLPIEEPGDEGFKIGPAYTGANNIKTKYGFRVPGPLKRPLLIALIAFLVGAFFRFKKSKT
mgnify:CR=1 FL=1